jgi:hypothetical protein
VLRKACFAQHAISISKNIKTMKTQLFNILLAFGGLVLGSVIGLAFGSIQNAALLRNKKQQEHGNLGSGWAVMPGSMRRVAFLMMALIVIQIACPLLFQNDSIQWMVSAGVVMGYGWTLLQQFRGRSLYRV